MLRVLKIIIAVIFLSVILAGCYDANELDEFAFVTAMGIDKGKSNVLMLTLQIANPSVIAGGGEGGGGDGGGDATVTLTLDTPSIMSGLNMANNFVNKQMDLSHTSLLVVSEEIAREDLSKYMYAFPKIRQLRPNINVAISKGLAKDFIKGMKPQLTKNPTKYNELIFNAYKYTGLAASSQLHRFYTFSKIGYRQSVAVLAGVGRFESSDEFTNEFSTFKEKGREWPLEGDYKAGDAPKEYVSKSEIMGLAVFDGGRMVGELDGQETTYYLMASNQYNYAYITLPDPEMQDRRIILNVMKSRNPKIMVDIVEGKPAVSLKIILEADIASSQSEISYEESPKTAVLEQTYEDFIEKGMTKFLEKTAKEFHSDICGFGNLVKRKCLTWEEWTKLNWLDIYKDSTFNVDVDLKIRRPGLTIRRVPIKSTKEDEQQ